MTSRWNAMLAISAAITGCASTPQAGNATAPERSGTRSPRVGDATRGMGPESERLGFDHALQLRRSKNGVALDLHDGDTVKNDDRIRASVLTSEDAYLYLAFCSHRRLEVYPPRGIRTRAGVTLFAPNLVLDKVPGPEVLYVIVSRTEVAIADPQLAEAIAATTPGGTPVDCGAPLDARLTRPTSHGGAAEAPMPAPTKILRGKTVARKPLPPPRIANTPGPGASAPASPSRDPGLPPPPPDPDFERNPGNIVWYSAEGAASLGPLIQADPDGIAVVRYGFTHVASVP